MSNLQTSEVHRASTGAGANQRWACAGILLLAVCETAHGADAAFTRHAFATGETKETVLAGAFLDHAQGHASVALVGPHTATDGPSARILALADDGWAVAVEARLNPRTLFVDKAAIAGQERLVAYAHGRVSWLDPHTGTQHALVEVETRYRSGEHGPVPRLDIMRDLNGDALDDLLLPDTDGFWVATQSSGGTFSEPAKLGPPEPYLAATAVGEQRPYGADGITAGNLPWYQGRVYQADYNQDGRDDLVFWNENRFDVHFQSEDGQFATVATPFRAEVPFDTDGGYSLMFEYTDENLFGLLSGLRKKTQLTMLHALNDMNGDGVADLVTQGLEGRSLGNHRSTYRVYFGAATAEGIAFPPEPDAWVRPRGSAGALQAAGYSKATLRDFDGDGTVDMLFVDVVVGLGGMLRAMIGRSVALNAELYRMEGDDFPRKPFGKRRVRPRLYPVGEGVFFPPVLVGDVHGDGHADLILGKGRDELRVYAGDDAAPWAGKPQTVAVALPDDERNTLLVDFNADGKDDVLIYNTRLAPHVLTTLIAQ